MKNTSLVLALAALFAASAFAQVDLEHFQCYAVRKIDPEITATVDLADQFATTKDVLVRRAVRFCNPTRKYHNGQVFDVADIRQHLTIYSIYPQDSPLRIVRISNQFGQQQTLLTRAQVALAVPTQKIPHDPPVRLDHYQCYEAWGPVLNQPAALSDQFITPFTWHQVLNPYMFCNPVEKTHAGNVTPIVDKEAHLACYWMTRVPYETVRDTRNQFGFQVVQVGPADTLCVPTRKLGFTVIPDSPPGTGQIDRIPGL